MSKAYIHDGDPTKRRCQRIVPMIKILQINVDGARMVYDLTDAKSRKLGINVLVECKQYHNRIEENGWFRDKSGKTAVVVLSQDVPIELVGPPEDIGFH